MQSLAPTVEQLLTLCGFSDAQLPLMRHVALVVLTVLLAWAAFLLCQRLLVPLVLKLVARTSISWDDVLLNRRVLTAASQIVPAVVVWQCLPHVFYQFPAVRELLARLTALYITVMSVRLALVFLNSFEGLEDGKRSAAQQYFKSFRGVLKIIVLFLAAIVVVAIIIDRSPLTLLAGLGATSAVLMLVFKDTISGLVAGVRLTSNDMLRKGDWITVPKAGADGIVEDISLTTVKIRNFDNTIVTVTPQTLVDDSFQNWIGMQESDGRRVKRRLYFDFRTICRTDDGLRRELQEKGYFKADELNGEQVNLTLFRRYVERRVAELPQVNEHMTLMVRLLEATQCGLPVEFYFFLHSKEWVNYEHELAEIMEQIYAVVPDFRLAVYQQFSEFRG